MRLTAILALAACGSHGAAPDAASPPDTLDAPEAPPVLALALHRIDAPGPDPIDVELVVTRGGAAVSGLSPEITSVDGAIGASTESPAGHYRVRITPTQPSGNVRIHAAALGRSIDRTAVVLPQLDARWGQAEQVPGLVNTAGYEDSAEVSPDGEWLLVSDYSPIDMLCCIFGTCTTPPTTAFDPVAPVCNTSLGPYAAPARPRLPGAERILSPTEIHDDLPPLGIVLPPGTDFARAFPPLIGYGFHRQADGSFAEPFTIGFAAGGATSSPFGYTFARPPVGTQATLIFAYDDLRNYKNDYGPATGNDLYRDAVTLGRDINFGTFSVDARGVPVTDRFPTLLPVRDRAGPQGNPTVSSDGVWFDTENGAEDLFFAAGDPLGTAPLAAPVTVALSRPDRKETMPYVHADRLYFSDENHALRSARRTPGGDPARASTWSAERVELSAEMESRVGAVVGVGEPSIETRDGVESLYFIYVIKTATGLDLGVARVAATP